MELILTVDEKSMKTKYQKSIGILQAPSFILTQKLQSRKLEYLQK